MAASTTVDAGKDELTEALSRIVDLLVRFQKKFVVYLGDERFYPLVSLSCLLVAVFYSWKLLKSEPQTENQTRRQSSSDQPRMSISSSIDDCSASASSNAQEVVDNFFSSVKPTLGQLINRRLCGGRKVTCQLLGVILQEKYPEELQEHATVKSSVLEVLSEMSKTCDLYLMERVLDDASEARILSVLCDAGVFTSCGLEKEKVLFCGTESGRASFVRQLEPDWHIDTNPDVIHQLARFIKHQLHISPIRLEREANNVFSSPSLDLFFGPSENN